ncbi:histidine phosphatase family protein [Paenibacillus sp. BGI2013]|uniref:histidine phosphatase family protein n=1 Tax=Paenibacillus TaxID=44249 RepID=UPI00096F7EF0|nr:MULTISPECIES: histidine phosphatase family protein [Paenibacillus]OMF43307.1 histidine phosphatase family protein [Paenibacillus amylolyticus]PKQ87858.1 histidine phosphatase family protein [Paenibacillus sp. BGI2013]
MKIYLVRHGMDEEGYRGGWSDRGLTEQGHIQSKKLGEHLHRYAEEYNIHTIISSDLPRAVQTTREIEKQLNMQASLMKDWREMNNGDLAGMLHKDAEEHYPGIYFNTLEMDSPFPGGESPGDFYNQISISFENLLRDIEDQTVKSNVLLITHGGVINILYYLLEKREWSNKSSFYPMDNTSVHTVEKGRHGWKLSSANVLSHLH